MSEETNEQQRGPALHREEKSFPADSHAPQQQIVNPEHQTTNMEVQKHPHHVTHKKKWQEYLLEFFMLFLAVFLGFLAENFREHQVEKERGKQFIESFYDDLKTDTAKIAELAEYDEAKISALTNLGHCYDTVTKNSSASSCLLNIIKYSSINRPFTQTDRTLKQLENAGGFRLLKREDADSILSYSESFNSFQDFQATVFQRAQDNVRSTFNQLINFNANTQMFVPEPGKLINEFNEAKVTAPLFFTNDKNLLNRYFNDLQLYYRVTYNHKRRLLGLMEKQTSLINYFKNRYHLE